MTNSRGPASVPPPIRFGTDGWRGVIADDFTFANVERVAQASAAHWLAAPAPGTRPLVVVGFDRRFLSDQFAVRAAEVLAGNGLEVVLTPEPTPTPAVSLAVRDLRAVGGVMLTASHNPAHFNGFKLKAWFGGSAGTEICQAVEARLDTQPVQRLPFTEAVRQKRIIRRDLMPAHRRAVLRHVDFERLADAGLRVAHDAMFGVGAGCFDKLLFGTNCRVTSLRSVHDPLFGGVNPEPIPAYYASTADWLKRHRQDVCLVTDGDADRLGGLDGNGRSLTTHQIISLLIEHFAANRGERGVVVKSVNTTSLVDHLCDAHGLLLKEVGIGFKYIGAELRRPGVLLGVEESGGIGYPPHLPERDGIAAGLWLLELLAVRRRTIGQLLGDLERRFGPHRYDRTGLRVPEGQAAAIEARLQADPPNRLGRSPIDRVVTTDGVKFVARDGSWLMLRGSGTEPLFRVYAESRSDAAVQSLLRQGRRLVDQIVDGHRPSRKPARPPR